MSFTNKKKPILSNDDGTGDTMPFRNRKMTLNIKPQNDIKSQQQNKRKWSDSKAVPINPQREEIQKRLNLLKQNTLKIVSKNVNNAKKKLQAKDHAPPVLKNQKKNTPKTSESTKIEKIIKTPSPVLQNQKETTPKVSETPFSSIINSAVNEKIGILRETSLTNNSESLYTSMQTSFTEKLSELINIESEYQLKVPETRLRTPIKDYIKNNNENTPFWLKPSSVQSYPYNFIMAVRKKLESLSNPIQGPLQKFGDDETKIRSNKYNLDCPEVIQKKQSISDINTNFSSISLNVQDSNTISDVSSIQSEIIRNVEENNIHSPLSVEKINNLRIQSERKSYTNEKEEPQQDLQKFFEAFNEKLSQCIEVNKQLYSSLYNPQRTKEISDGEKEKENIENSRSLMGNEILSVFNQFDLNNTVNTSAISESNFSYSNIGMVSQFCLGPIKW